eukprot:TRINITY_DN1717_c0_g1_i1.p1 TRINITY_DN1717_c0_g1~~TRINITY_DN1717_c0_g1_i1.p1  ORF type:complete len:883 (+),score=208.59 TRINITY_DN1717_c0_g1_i1:47-2650(+)
MAPKQDSKPAGSQAKEVSKDGEEQAASKEESADATMTDAAAKEDSAPQEPEADAPADARKKVAADAVAISGTDTTLNVMPTTQGNFLMCLSEGGMQYLLAGARATAGIKKGRYMFEVQVVENCTPAEPQGQARAPAPRQLVRVGLSVASSSLFLADSEDSVCFDSEGFYTQNRKRAKGGKKFGVDQTVAIVANLDKNTVSLFIDGERASQPQALPEHLHGKALYPTVTYRNVTVRTNFGPTPLAKLPFNCRMLADAAQEDLEIQPTQKDQTCEVVFPVGLPDKGLFDWADQFLAAHPTYTEISDRKIIEWATKSGVQRTKAQKKGSNDQPTFACGLPLMEDLSAKRVLSAVAPLLKRNYLVMELRSNLCSDTRAAAMARFQKSQFKRTAVVCVGEPSADYKKKVQEALLADKQSKADAERKKREVEAERKRLLDEKRKKAEEAKKAREAAAKKKKKQQAGEDAEEAAEEAEDAKMEEPKEEEEPPKQEEAPAPVELTEEEKSAWYIKHDTPDLTEEALGASFAKFSAPSKEEGFDEVRFEWQDQPTSIRILKEFVLEQKKTQKVQDFEGTEWFKEQWSAWQKEVQAWKAKQREWKEAQKKASQQKKKDDDGEEPAEEEFDPDEVDPMKVEDLNDIGHGQPLFAHFVYEDWALLSVRFELHLLVHAFRKALEDPDRASFPESHLEYYYSKLFHKSFSVKAFACETFADLVKMINESIDVKDDGYLHTPLEESTSHSMFVQLTEQHRRDRENHVNAGDESARLKFPQNQRPVMQQQQSRPVHGAPSSAGQTKRPMQPSAQAPSAYGAAKRPRPAGYGGGYGAPPPAYGAYGGAYGAPPPAYGAYGGAYGAPAPSAYGAGAGAYGGYARR